MEEQPITLRFEFTSNELCAAVAALRRQRTRRASGLAGWYGAIILGVLLYELANTDLQQVSERQFARHYSLVVGIWLAGFTLFWALIFRSARRSRIRFFQQAKLVGIPRTVTFSSAGVTAIALYTREESEWHAFEKLIETDRFFMLMTSSVWGMIIPKRAFSDAEEMERFRKLALSHIDLPMARRAFPVGVATKAANDVSLTRKAGGHGD